MKTLEERKAILEAVIVKHQKNGWTITNRTDINCQLTKPKKPETCLVILLLLLFIIPGLLYLIFIKGNMTVFIEVDEYGKVKYSSKDISPYQLAQAEKETADLIVKPEQSTKVDESTQNLGLLTIKSIAEGLKITEEEVVKLIETNELKGKKIGDKYFVRKEDFDEFMKK
ncbi:MAG TPA: helix-turn-helix domain-containing protein [Bacteroidales bacterium]